MRHYVKRMEYIKNSESFDESHIHKSKAFSVMSEQVSQLVEELSVRDDQRIKLAEAQVKLQALVKDKQSIE